MVGENVPAFEGRGQMGRTGYTPLGVSRLSRLRSPAKSALIAMRERLPMRRASEVMEFLHVSLLGHPVPHTAALALYNDGRVG